mgnify:CR=1 FL=1
MNASAKPVERFFKSFLAAALAVTLCPLVSTEKAQAQEVAGRTDLTASIQTAGEDEAEAVDPGESVLAPDAPDDGLALTGENGVIEEDAAAGDSDLALQASASATVEWNKCGTAEWSVDSSGKMTIRPIDGNATGEWDLPQYWANIKSEYVGIITSVSVQGSVVAPNDCSHLFSYCRSLESVDLSGLDVSNVETMEGMFQECSSLKNLIIPADFNTSNVKSMASMFDGCSSLQSIDFARLGSPSVTDTSFLFRDCKAMDFSNIAGFDTSGVQNMSGMFMRCNENGTLKPSDLNTSSVTDMSQMFVANYASSLSLKGVDTSKVTDMSKMFYGCRTSSIDLGEIDTSSVTDMSWMFRDCENLSNLDLSSLDTSNVRNMSKMFCGIGASKLDLRSFDTKNVTDMSSMFSKYRNDTDPDSTYSRVMPLESVDLSSFDTSSVTDMGGMFYGCTNLLSVDVGSFNTSNVENMAGMFNECTSLASLDLRRFDLSHVKSMSSMFYGMNSLTTLDLSNHDASSVESMRYMFGYCPSLREIDLSGFKTQNLKTMYGTFIMCDSLEKLDLSSFGTSNVTDFSFAFCDCKSLKEIDLSSFRTSSAVDMHALFSGCESLQSIDLSGFDTSNVKDFDGIFSRCSSLAELDAPALETGSATDMGAMFSGCSSLKSIDLSKFDTSKVTDMGGLFSGCSSLESLDLSPLKTSKVTDMGSMFSGCSSLESLDLSPLDTSSVTSIGSMFSGCSSLTSLDLSRFNTSKVVTKGSRGDPAWTTNINLFKGCSSLKSLDLSNFNTSGIWNMGSMFEGCSSLESLDLSSFNTANATKMQDMFKDCSNLKTISLGERFSFNGWGTQRLCALPDTYSRWVRVPNGPSYSYDGIPNNMAATYAADESSKSSFELEEGMFAIDTRDAVYTGSTIRDRVTSGKLIPGTDYRVSYSNAVNAGTATIEIVGLGKYKGSIEKTFTILPASMEDVAVRSVPDQEWTGSAVKPKLVVKYGAQELVEGVDCTFSYKNNVDAGVATVTIAGIGNFSGAKDVDYKIVKAESPEPQQFAITYHLDGGVNAASNPAAFAAGTAVALAAPTREGYEFEGWYADAKLTKRVVEIPADASGDVELWAKWAKKAPASTFPDVDYSESSWYGKAVTYVAERGLVTGYTAGEKAGQFGVGDSLTRAQLATILWRNACPDEAASYDPASAKDETGIAGSADGQYYTAAANWAVENGVISGYDRPDGTKDFAANDDVTFEQLVTILARLCATPGELASAGSDLSAFADGAEASAWSRAAFAWAASKGLVEGYDTDSGKYLAPTEDVARERVAVVLMRAFEMGILK